jgi:hypothetical protein
MCSQCWIDGFLDKWIIGRSISAPIHPYIHQSNHPVFFVVAGSRESNKKPTTVSSRGFLSKFCLTTSANGVVSYDDQQQSNLSNIS